MIIFINEDGNKELKGRKFMLGKGIKKHLMQTLKDYNGDKTIDGYKRLNNILEMDGIDYNEMKRIKNFFDNYNGTNDNPTYILNGGDEMKNWVDNTLNSATTAIRDIKRDKKEMGIKNAFIKPHTKTNGLKPNNQLKVESKQRVVYITENQYKLLKEAASDGFSLEELSRIPSFKGRYEYCVRELGPTQGRGSSRVVFQLDDSKILKLALNNKGIAQNGAECDYYLQQIGLTPEIFNHDNDWKWMVCEYVLPAKKRDFVEAVGLTFEKWCEYIQAIFKYRQHIRVYTSMSEDEYIKLSEENETCQTFEDYIANYNPPMGDLLRLVNYGLVKRDGYIDIVLLDAGLTHDIWSEYYKK